MSRGAQVESIVEEERVCPECQSDHLVLDYVRGELVCDGCGLVVRGGAIDEGPDWSAYSAQDARRLAHAGAPRGSLSGASGLATVIPFPKRDAHGNTIPFRERGTFYRMQKLQRHSSHSFPGERSLPETIRVLNRFASLMVLPRSVKDEAGFICRKAMEEYLSRGRSIETLVAAAVYAACRIDGVPRTLDELQQVTGLPKKTIGGAYRVLRRRLGLSVPVSLPTDYVRRFCSELRLSNHVEQEAVRILREQEQLDRSRSVSPAGTTAAAIYLASLACGEHRPQRAVAKVAGVSEVTLRNRFRFMKDFTRELALPRGRPRKQLARSRPS